MRIKLKSINNIIIFSILSAIFFISIFLTPNITIDNFPVIEMLNGFLFLSFWITSIIAIIIALINWKKIPVYAKIVPFVTLTIWLFLLLLYKFGTPNISAEIKYVGSRDSIVIDFCHGWGSSRFDIKKNELWKDDDVGHATRNYSIKVKDDFCTPVKMETNIDMTKEVSQFGFNNILYITISDDKIEYKVK